ncbi:YcxB family protein [Clostridium sp. UBA4548]|uniref:YcxB family protein n=1 Tax=Clostridium sp. UBA4548 TaxID=1946361 RepID=UPI0025BC4FC4|nr:YcxB family protein [Clostridium sp. UBA4548]
MISIGIKYNSNDTFELAQFICKKLYKNSIIAIRIIQTIFSLVMIYIATVYVEDKIILSIIFIVLLLLYILAWNLYLIANYFYSKKNSNLHQNTKITFEDDYFIVKSESGKKSYCYQYKYSTIQAIYDEENKLFIMLDNLATVILIPKRELGVGDYDKLIDYLKLKIDNNFSYKTNKN